MTGGYEERQRAPDLFDIGFFGNGSIAIGVVRDYARLRASQVAIEHGFNYFLIEGEVTDMEITLSGGKKPFCVITIRCFVDEPEGASFKSTEVRDALQQQYKISSDMKPPPEPGG